MGEVLSRTSRRLYTKVADHVAHNDSYTPVEIARKVEQYGVTKGNLPFGKLAALSTMAGGFVSMGAMLYLITTNDIKAGYGMTMLAGGFVFNLGLMLCIIAGAELFTGNCLMSIAVANRKITLGQMFRNLSIVWVFNFLGALIMVGMLFLADAHTANGGQVGARALYVAASKGALSPGVIFMRGLIANIFVCLASWMAYSGRTITDKFYGMLLPIIAFVAGGYEHSIANMFYFPLAMLAKGNAAIASLPGVPVEKLKYLTPGYFAQNLVFSTLGNLIGGAVFVGLAYWWIYFRSDSAANATKAKNVA